MDDVEKGVSGMKNISVKNLGEIALRVRDLDAMQKFYEDVVGLELMKRFPQGAFFKNRRRVWWAYTDIGVV
jgi:catechol 2,3-dioxygenase-like lactoylglutathione lyase family enzyme